jgi:hypothetical protein
MMKRDGSRAVRIRRLTAGLAISVAVACGTVVPTSSAVADPSGDGTAPAAVAGLTPLLRILDFGTAIGMPLACNLVTSVVTAGAAEAHAAHTVSGVVTQIIDQCTSLSQSGDKALQQAIAQSKAMTLINPVLNPVIAGMATGSHVVGADNATSVAPFGPTIDGLGGTIAFFEGS